MSKCPICRKPFTFREKYQLTKTKTPTCPKCKNTLKETTVSKLLFGLIFILPIVYFMSIFGEWDSILKWFYLFIWIVFCLFILQPVLYRYDKTKS
ncbi:hypothetical protein COP00_07715 [Bacillus glycinifermentans]|uniref:Uncharacterized protein n=1 Tax=Bacillus glycinifermentans TaxID=1664069 RepID=A0A0T6BUE9_9BACI|nr:hypothetical protein COP00_07715 [Bacillus glycinifermentans]KRT95268.1 hypothetical protein AB447_212250 [Bacillus glycinifermentans]